MSSMALQCLFLRNCALFVLTYPRTLVIGKDCDEENSIYLDLSNLKQFYLTILAILDRFRQTRATDKNETLKEICSHRDFTYYYKFDKETVSFIVKKGDLEILAISLDYPQFNELLYTISESIIPMLCLTNLEAEFFEYILEVDVVDLVKLIQFDKFCEQIHGSKYDVYSSQLFRLYKFYLDVLFITLKLKKFANPNLLPNNLQSLLQPTSSKI